MHPWLVYTELVRLPTYFTCLMVGFALASVVLRREAVREGLSPRAIMDLALLTLPAVLIGARLTHVALVAPRFYWAEPLEILKIAYGGFVFYGGLGSGGLMMLAWARRTGVSPWRLGDVFAPATAFGLIFGRLGCLGAGCCYGKAASWPFGIEVPWAIRYWHRGHVPDDLLAMPLHPSPLYEALLAWGIFVALGLWRRRQQVEGEVLLGFLALYGIGRSALEVLRGDVSRGLYLDGMLSTSQIIGLGSAIVALGLLAWRRRSAVARRRPPSVMVG